MKIKALLLASAALVAIPAAASAQDAGNGVTVSGNIALTSDYVWRGISQSDEGPALQLGFDVTNDLFYVGTWASNVDFGTDVELEWDVYAGIKPTIGPVTFDFGVLGYLYPQDTDTNVWEAKAAASIASEAGASATLAVFYSPEYGNDGPSTLYTELSGSVPLPGTVGPFSMTLGGSIGQYSTDDPLFTAVDDSYTNYKVSLTFATEAGWAIEAAYTDTDLDFPGLDVAEGRGILTLKRVF
jgi:uncharacterized protein (TIGR02001 family)